VSEYILPHGDAVEEQRLALLERHHDPDSIAALERTGVGPGWECLDVGAGAGSISRWLLKRGAKVLATDLDVRGLEGVETRVHDITSDEPLGRTFDLVHTRLVLLHLPSRVQVIERLVALTRPGGWLVVGDIDFTPVAMRAPTPEWQRTWEAWCAATQAAGWDLACGPQLVDMLGAAGVQDLAADRSGYGGPGGSDPLLILSLAFERLRPRLVEHGASDADITAARAALEDPAQAFVAPATWTARGTRS
jgi:SAM-dependent methyltransferase